MQERVAIATRFFVCPLRVRKVGSATQLLKYVEQAGLSGSGQEHDGVSRQRHFLPLHLCTDNNFYPHKQPAMDIQNATVVVQLPQDVLTHLMDSLQEIRTGLNALVANGSAAAALSTVQAPSARIPLTAFRDNPKIAELYQLSYEKVMELCKKCELRSYADKGRTRYRWTTHEDIISYIDGIRNEGIVAKKRR